MGGSTPDGVAGSTSGRVYAVLFDRAGRKKKKPKPCYPHEVAGEEEEKVMK